MLSRSRVLQSVALATLVSTFAIGLIMLAPAGFWSDWYPATCLANGCFCEEIDMTASVRQPINAWSSLAFVFAGCYSLLASRGTRARNSRMPAAYSRVLGGSLIVIGIGSAFYHASMTFLGQFFDVFGMYLLSAFMLVYALERLYHWPSARSIRVYVGLMSLLSVALIVMPETRRYLFALLLLVAIPLEYLVSRRKGGLIHVRWLTTGLLLMAIAYAIWVLDNSYILCSPSSALQGHAVWHLLGAVSAWYLHRYYLSEEIAHAEVESSANA